MNQALLSWLYYIVFTVYVAISGAMALRRPQSVKSNLITLIFAAASVWALCLTFATISPNMDTSLFWRRLGVLGWGTIYSFILHLTIITTGRGKHLARRWLHALLYLPAAINIILFLLAGESANRHFQLHFIRFGWINTWVGTFANWFHAVYYVAFIGLSILLFLLWSFKTRDPAEKKQAKWFMLSLFAAAFLGSLTDFVNGQAYDIAPPQLGIVFVLFPAMVLFFLISKYDFLKADTPYIKTDSGMLSGDGVWNRQYEHVGYLINFTGFFNLANRVLLMRDFAPLGFWVWGVLLSILLTLGGTAVTHARRLGLSAKAQRLILIATVVTGLACTVYAFLPGADALVWGPLLLVAIAAAVFDSPAIPTLGVLAQISIQIHVIFAEGLVPEGERLTDYTLHVAAIAAGVYFIYHANRLYQARHRKNREHARMQTTLLKLSRSLQAHSDIAADDALDDVMDIIAQYLRCHRAAALLYRKDETISFSISRVAEAPGDAALRERMRDSYEQLLSGYAFSQAGEVFSLDIEASGQTPVGRHMRAEGIQRIVFSPFLLRDGAMGILLVELQDRRRARDKCLQDFLHIASEDLCSFVLRALKEQELKDLAYQDPLTGLLRREQCIARIDERIIRQKQGELIAVMFIDIDNFKSINDTAGHRVGDRVLAIIGRRFRMITRTEDVLGRIGGDEFLCLTTQTSPQVIESIADRLIGTLSRPIYVDGARYTLSASIGIAMYPNDGADAEILLKRADIAMYHSKTQQKGNYLLYDPWLEKISL